MKENEEFEERVKEYNKKLNNPVVKVKLVDDRAEIPIYATSGSAGFDFKSLDAHTIVSKEVKVIDTGIAMDIPRGWELQVRPRSGLSLKTTLRIPNSPGTIDSDYRETIGIILENTGKYPISIKAGDRIAQGVLARAPQAIFEKVETLVETDRKGGFGSTGK